MVNIVKMLSIYVRITSFVTCHLLVIRNVCSCSDPTRPAADGLLHRVHQELHAWEHPHAQTPTQSQVFGLKNEPEDTPRMGLTVVELAVWLLTVDDVEAVGGPHAHAAHFKVEPLVVVITVNIRVQDQIVLKSVGGAQELKPTDYNINHQQNWYGKNFRFDHIFYLNVATNTYFLIWTAFLRLPDSNCELNLRDSPLSAITGQLKFETWQ